MKSTKRFKNVDEYIKSFPKDIQPRIKILREIVRKNAPKAEEVISYNMPAYKLDGSILVYFNAYEHHIGLYPYPSAIKEFKKESEGYKTRTGTIQFDHSQKLPVSLISKMIKFRIKEKLTKKKA